MTKDELKDVLEKHAKYLADGAEGVKANLRDADLLGADLRDADLSHADLRYANLSWADLRDADLRYADLRYANLSWADLRDADLRYANLRDANLCCANLSDADLSDANLRWADLDYSVFFLGCKTLGIKTCKRLPFQLAYHICRMKSDDAEVKEMQRLLAPFANMSHVIETHSLPKIEDGGEVRDD